MSDDTPAENGGFEFPPGVPDDLKHFMTRQYERQSMENNANRHRIVAFFDELSLDQLQTLCALFDILEDNPERATYFLGFSTAMMEHKFKICAACGQNHEAMIASDA